MIRRWFIRASIFVTILFVCLVLLTVLLPQYESKLPRESQYSNELIAMKMDPWLLVDGLASKTVIEIDWVTGCKPREFSIEALKTLLEKYGPNDRTVEIVWSDEIPLAEWNELIESENAPDTTPVVQRYASQSSDTGVEHRYVLFAPEWSTLFGFSTRWTIKQGEGLQRIHGVVILREQHQKYARLMVDLDKIERGTLIHEFGHQLGLVNDPRHEQSESISQLHCTRLDCSMARPTPRVIARNILPGIFGSFLHDFCSECQDNISTAKTFWRQQRENDDQWIEKVRAKRSAELVASRVWNLMREEKYELALSTLEEAEISFPDSPTLAALAVQVLCQMGRIDEALRLWQPLQVGTLQDRERAQSAWSLARLMIRHGRHSEGFDLLEPLLRPEQDDYLFEQTSFVAFVALEGCNRFAEAAELTGVLLERGHTYSFIESQMQRSWARRLRRAGLLTEADNILRSLLESDNRNEHLLEAARLQSSQGNEPEALLLKQEWLEEHLIGQLDDGRKISSAYSHAVVLSGIGHQQEATILMDKIDAAITKVKPGRYRSLITIQRARALVNLGRIEEAIELWRELNRSKVFATACSEESLIPHRDNPAYADLFHCCE